jgi:hypothetical protein
MSQFHRRAHWRKNSSGTICWVSSHSVHRDHWDSGWAKAHSASSVYRASDYRASDFLRRSNVGQGAQSCFVNPNAKCPVCTVPVFYYQNSFGSRVYFDELGPPWTKHPCTDNLRSSAAIAHPKWTPITKRTKGEVREIIEYANVVGLLQQKQFGERKPNDWSLLLIEEANRSGERNEVRASVLDSFDEKVVRFFCYSEAPLFEPGEFMSMRGNEISFFDQQTMTTFTVAIGERVKPQAPAPDSSLLSPPAPEAATVAEPAELPPFDLARFRRTGMTVSERKQFPKDENFLRSFVARLRPAVERMIADGARSPEDFAALLNARSQRTFTSERWNVRLANFLLSYMFEVELPPKQKNGKSKPVSLKESSVKSDADFRETIRPPVPQPKTITRPIISLAGPKPTNEPLTREELANRLSAFGRVSFKSEKQ